MASGFRFQLELQAETGRFDRKRNFEKANIEY
jgi:hypothetical protein